MTNEQDDLTQILSRAFGREVAFREADGNGESPDATAEKEWPDIAGLDHRDAVIDFGMPTGTFFDTAVVHLLTTGTMDRLSALDPEGRLRSGVSGRTSSSRPDRSGGSSRTAGSVAPSRSAATFAWRSPSNVPGA